MNYQAITKTVCIFIIYMQLTSCALMRKIDDVILANTPQPCINVANSISRFCLFPFSLLEHEKRSNEKGQYIPLGFQLKTPAYYQIHANIYKWEKAGHNLWRSREFVEFKCHIHDSPTMLGNESKSLYFFEYDNQNRRYFIMVTPFSVPQGQLPLYIYIQSTTKPGQLTIDFSDKNDDFQQYIHFRSYFFKLNNKVMKHRFAVKRFEKALGLFIEHPVQEIKSHTRKQPVPVDSIQKKKPKRQPYPESDDTQPFTSNDLHPVGILLCNNGNYHIKASVEVRDWQNKGNYWQGLMYTFWCNDNKYIGLTHRKRNDFGESRFELQICKASTKGDPLLINVYSQNKPGKLRFSYHTDNSSGNPKFIDFSTLNQYFSLDGKMPARIVPDRDIYTYKSSRKKVVSPALMLSFIKSTHVEKIRTQKIKRYKTEHVSKELKVPVTKKIKRYKTEPVYQEPTVIVEPEVISPDPFNPEDNIGIISGMYFHKPGTYDISASIKRNEWQKVNGSWTGQLYTFKSSCNNIEQPPSFGLIYKQDNIDGRRFQVNFGKRQEGGKSLVISVLSSTNPGNLLFRYHTTLQYPVFIPFNEIANAFSFSQNPARWLNDDIPDDLYPAINLFPSKQRSAIQHVENNTSSSSEKIGILPFSIMLTDKLGARLNKQTIQNFHLVVKNAFLKHASMRTAVLAYPNNVEPYSIETTETPDPTIDPIVEDKLEYVFGNICKKSNTNMILFGHFEEDLRNYRLNIIIRVFDCQSSTYETFKQIIPVTDVSEKTVYSAIMTLINMIEPYIKRTI